MTRARNPSLHRAQGLHQPARRSLSASLVVATAVALCGITTSCSSAEDRAGTTSSTGLAAPVDPPSPGTGTEAVPSTGSADPSTSSQPAAADASAPTAPGETNATRTTTGRPATDDDSGPGSGSERTSAPTVRPPDYSSPDSILTEDAFDGPDLELVGVTADDSDPRTVVLRFEGTGYPGWKVQYVDPEDEASSRLEVTLSGVTLGTPPSDLPSTAHLSVTQSPSPGTDPVLLIDLDQEPHAYRVHLQYDPLRLVIEVTSMQ